MSTDTQNADDINFNLAASMSRSLLPDYFKAMKEAGVEDTNAVFATLAYIIGRVPLKALPDLKRHFCDVCDGVAASKHPNVGKAGRA